MPDVVSSDGTRLFYKDLGDGPTVLLLHSWALHSGMWEYLLQPLLDAGHRVVALDRRGHGRSDYAARGFDIDTLVDDIGTVLDHAGVDEHAVMAHSTGGIEAVHLAARRGGVRALVLLAPLGPNMDGEVGRAPLDATLADLRTDRPGWFRSQGDAYFGRPHVEASDALIDETLAVLYRTPLEVATALMTTAWTTDATALAAALTVPTLILHGDADASAPLPVTGRRYAELIPSAALTVYPGAGHGLYATHAGEIGREVVAFLTAYRDSPPRRRVHERTHHRHLARRNPVPSYAVCHVRTTRFGPAIASYLERIDATLAPYGGRFAVHGGPVEVLEGSWDGDLIVIAFPDHEAATSWYHSAAYQGIADLRRDNTDGTLVVVDGVPPDHRATDILDSAH